MTSWTDFRGRHRHQLPDLIFLLLTVVPWLIFALLPYLASK
ncbi:hypothetical protein [Paludibaculum fermentans]